jgi:hypothetical protein
MESDLFEQLTISDVPPVPPEFDRHVHQRLNAMLLTQHLFEFAWQAMPQALGMLLISVWHGLAFTITGHLTDRGAGITDDR